MYQRWRPFASGVLIATALIAAGGCSRTNRAAVSGTVLVDNEPLKEGAITFFPTDGTEGPSAGTTIEDGEYYLPREQGATIGTNRVEIRGFRTTGKKVRDPMAKEKGQLTEERVPALAPEYNDKSTLVREVKEDNNVLDFDLPGTGAKKK